MSKPRYTGPKLPSVILDKVNGTNSSVRSNQEVSRKERRKLERQQKSKPPQTRPSQHRTKDALELPKPAPKQSRESFESASKPLKSILKSAPKRERPERPTTSEDEVPSRPRISRAVQQRLDEDDAEIAALEKKLGIRGKKSKVLEEDGLDWLAHGSDDDTIKPEKRKRAEDDDWLSSKRRKAVESEESDVESESDHDDEDILEPSEQPDSDMEGLENPFSDDELDSDDFDAFESEDDTPPVKKKRENPYVAPVSAKYIPPSLRKAVGQDEDLAQLRRQVQGQLNRLSEANFVSILSAVEDIYTKNARQHVTSTLIDLFMGLVTSPSTLNETFLILHSAFATALYKVTGPDFGAQLLEKITEAIKTFREADGKQVLNLLAFLANLYIMQMVGSTIVYDYIRGLLDQISEDNTELLLRIIRTAGVQLRQDDPTALKDIVLLLTRSVSQVGESNLSVRTKFMIETINDLKNNKVKAPTTDHVVRMKKTLGSLNTRSLRATEPLQVSLTDLEDSEKKGKWWLVGASYHDPAKMVGQPSTKTIDDGYESETPDHVSLPKLARAQGMNTDVRRAIFIAIMSASDFKDAHMRIIKLNLKNKQIFEVAKVLLHCAGTESVYNPYYTLIARKLCSELKLQKAFQSSLWDVLRKISEDDLTTTAVVNTARLYGTLIAEDQISIAALKTLEFAVMPSLAQAFAEVLLTTILLRAQKTKDFEQTVHVVFAQASSAPRMIQGLQLFLRGTVAKAEIANSVQERQTVQRGCELAVEVLSTATSVVSDDSDSD